MCILDVYSSLVDLVLVQELSSGEKGNLWHPTVGKVGF